MCGLAGYVGNHGDAALMEAVERLGHRGPDDVGVWFSADHAVGLGHRRLSILDLTPLGHQPMQSENGSAVLVFNGEIYNFRELRQDLEKGGARFRGRSDTEVVLALYARHGKAMLGMLNGMFALALWDQRTRSVLLARDALGVKPLYYAQGELGVAFASEIRSLLALVPDSRDLDIRSLHRYLTYLWCPGSGTPLRNVRKLVPGEAMTLRDGEITDRWAWYRLPSARGVNTDLSKDDALIGTTDQLRRAVHRQLVADVPVGAFLSGGLDSSAVVTFASEQVSDIRCFTIDLRDAQDDGLPDDLPYARRVARHLGVPLDVVEVDSTRMADDLEHMIAQMGEPLADPAPLNVLYISQLARRHGYKVLLSGAGGDDLFTGYRRHAAVQYGHLLGCLPTGAQAVLRTLASKLDQRNALGRRLTRLLETLSLEGNRRLTAHFAWGRESELMELYSPEARAALEEESTDTPMLEFLDDFPPSVSSMDRMLALEQRFFLADHNLTYTDRMSMAVGVEVRVPFLDLDLVEYAARIPHVLKQRRTVGKWILKKAMEPYLPKDVIYRPKSGFGAPLRRWMRSDLRKLLEDLLSPDALRRRGLFQPAAVWRLIEQNDSGKVDAAYTLLSLLCIEIWCRAFLDDRLSVARS